MNNFIILILLVVSFKIAGLCLNMNKVSYKEYRNSRIDALRGILAMSVFSHHFALTYHWKKTGLWGISDNTFVSNLGTVSVSMFFLITGYLFSNIILNNNDIKWWDFLKNRIFRIMPSYLVIVMIIYITYLMEVDKVAEIKYLLGSALYSAIFVTKNLGSFDLLKITSGVQWTLVYEVIFYLSLPIFNMIFSKQVNGRLMIVSFIAAIIIGLYSETTYLYEQLFYLFLLGAGGHFISKSIMVKKLSASKVCSVITFILIVYCLMFTKYWSIQQMLICSVCFIFIVNGCDVFGILNSNTLKKIGDISYSLYLTHGVVLYYSFSFIKLIDITLWSEAVYYLMLPLITIPVIITAKLLYYKVEYRFMYKKGRGLN